MSDAPIYCANIYYARKDMTETETSTSIQFRCADGFKGAKAAAYRWWLRRHAVVPDVFDRLYCIKIYGINPGEVEADGTLMDEVTMLGPEWKCDHGPIEYWLRKVS